MIVFIRDYLLENLWIYYLIGIITYILIRIIYMKRKKKILDGKKELLYFIFACYLIVIFSATVMPTWYESTIDGVTRIGILRTEHKFNFIPFRTILYFWSDTSGENSVINLLANIGLLFPFGVLFPVIWKKYRKRTILFGTLISLSIEILQIIPGRSTDIDDLILNVIGCAVGYWIVCNIYKKMNISQQKLT